MQVMQCFEKVAWSEIYHESVAVIAFVAHVAPHPEHVNGIDVRLVGMQLEY
jgi:hypothetical protein